MDAWMIALAAAAGFAGGSIATLITARLRRPVQYRFHHGAGCPGHFPGSPAARSRTCPASASEEG